MKKNILSYVILLFGIAIISTGCIKADTTITFDNKDNMKVETTVLLPQELMKYADSNVDTSKDDLTKDIDTKANGIKIETTVQNIDSKDGVGTRKIEICKNISKAKFSKISMFIPQNSNNSILSVKNYVFFKKYIFRGQLEQPEKTKTSDSQVNPNSIEFYMLNWFAIIATIIILLLLILYILNSGKGKFDFSVILAKSKEFFANTAQKKQTTTIEIKTAVKPKQKKNPAKFIVITLVLLCIIGVSIFFSLPTICNILVDNSIKSVYVGETAKAVQMIEIANALNFDKNTDLSKEIFAKGLKEIENNDTKTAKVLFDLVAKTKTQNNKKYASELTDKASKALKQNQLSKCKYLTEAAVRFDIEIPKIMTTELSKKQYDLAVKKKYQEALVISEILIMLEPKNAENHFRHGASLAFLGKDKEAISAYTEAIKLKRDFGSAYLNRGLIYAHRLSDDNKAFADLEQAINFCSAKNELAMAKLNISRIYMKKQNYERATVNACSAEEIFFELGDHNRRMESMNLCNTAICKSGGYCGPIYY